MIRGWVLVISVIAFLTISGNPLQAQNCSDRVNWVCYNAGASDLDLKAGFQNDKIPAAGALLAQNRADNRQSPPAGSTKKRARSVPTEPVNQQRQVGPGQHVVARHNP